MTIDNGARSVDPTAIAIDFDPTVQRMSGVARHGHTPFDVPYISHIVGNLYQGGCCRDGLILPPNIKHLISLYKWENYLVPHELGSRTIVTMYDSEDQGFEQVEELAELAVMCMEDGPTLIHCQAGLNRSSLIAARAIMLGYGATANHAIELIRGKRSLACLCNRSFEEWLRSL